MKRVLFKTTCRPVIGELDYSIKLSVAEKTHCIRIVEARDDSKYKYYGFIHCKKYMTLGDIAKNLLGIEPNSNGKDCNIEVTEVRSMKTEDVFEGSAAPASAQWWKDAVRESFSPTNYSNKTKGIYILHRYSDDVFYKGKKPTKNGFFNYDDYPAFKLFKIDFNEQQHVTKSYVDKKIQTNVKEDVAEAMTDFFQNLLKHQGEKDLIPRLIAAVSTHDFIGNPRASLQPHQHDSLFLTDSDYPCAARRRLARIKQREFIKKHASSQRVDD